MFSPEDEDSTSFRYFGIYTQVHETKLASSSPWERNMCLFPLTYVGLPVRKRIKETIYHLQQHSIKWISLYLHKNQNKNLYLTCACTSCFRRWQLFEIGSQIIVFMTEGFTQPTKHFYLAWWSLLSTLYYIFVANVETSNLSHFCKDDGQWELCYFLVNTAVMKHWDIDALHYGVCNYRLCGFHFVELITRLFFCIGKVVNFLVYLTYKL